MFHSFFLRKLLKDVLDKKGEHKATQTDYLKYRKQEDLHKGKVNVEPAGWHQSEIPRQLCMVLENNQFRLAKEDKEQWRQCSEETKNFYFN